MDLQILDSLLKFPKKKQIKKLFQHCLALNNQQKIISENFSTPVIQALNTQIGLSSGQVHRLILSITSLFKITALVNFDEQRLSNILTQLDEGIKEVVVGILLSFADQIREIQTSRIRQGKRLDIDNMDWNLATQIGNQKGKSNTPIVQVSLPLEQFNKSSIETVKFEMRGEQFEVFFNNLTKIKQTLNDLVAQS